ncbi:MFS general substrate transporter [Coniochaeta ligniaria NRRL 30616]|uniref:MFS general substrate transporter n=1 Tax=Coniochaeta ligniaria NRRL 30616 TaxID=1408157 RepID=A0A1J7IJP4_9PEZI|nr:MFS general substrate transporter [Coniochaeta ligniaria NRRL 30616]
MSLSAALTVSKLNKQTQTSATEQDAAVPPAALPAYSIFTRNQIILVLCLASFAATFSPLSSFIFFPAIDDLSRALDVSVGRVNLTITSYMIVAGLAPAILGDLADNIGRRAVYLFMMSVYCIANIGLALQRSWTALFLLRMLQSAGSAATIALGYGVVSDVAPPSERGAFVSGLVLGPNVATAIGPILGSALTSYAGWRWIFGFLAILSGTCLFLVALLLPETARSVVGNGSGKVSGLRRPLLTCFGRPTQSPSLGKSDGSDADPSLLPEDGTESRFRLPNPLASLKLLWAKDSALITLIFGIFYMNLNSLQASTSTLFVQVHDISGIELGLVYLPSGIGSCIGAYYAGSLLDHDYCVVARENNIEVDKRAGDDLTTFPIEKARFRSIWYVISAGALSMIGYGWSMHFKVNMAVPLVLHFVIGLSTAVVFNMCGTLLVDIHPKSPSTAQAANSIVRAFLAGGGTACVQVFVDAMGIGWTFTLFGGLGMACLGLAWLEWLFGKSWRDKMAAKGVKR